MRLSRPFLAWWLICGPLSAGVVVLKNGRAVAGLSEFQELPHQLRAVTPDGVTIYFDLEQIDREATQRLNPRPAEPEPALRTAAAGAPPGAAPRRGGGTFNAGASRVVAEVPELEAAPEPSATEQAWHQRAAELQRSIDYRERELRAEEGRLRDILVAESVGAYTVEGALVRQRIERALAHLHELHRERSRLEDEARRGGIPPGWLRIE